MSNKFDYIIVGAGPAGLQLAYYMQKNNINYKIIESGEESGTSFKRYPRHGKLISINKVYTGIDDPEVNLRWDWNSLLCEDDFSFKQYTDSYFPDASDLVTYFNDFSSRFSLDIDYKKKVENIKKIDDVFHISVESSNEKYECNHLVIATGVSKPFIPDIPGIEHTENYTQVSVDKKDFINQKVLVLGKGNSAFETADNLVDTTALIHVCSPSSVKLAWQTHYVGNLRAVNNNFLDTYQLKSQNALLDAEIEKIEKSNDQYHVTVKYNHASGEEEVLVYDRVIVCTGFKFDTDLFDSQCQPDTVVDGRFPKLNADWESSNISQLYFAGTLMQGNFYKKTTSGFIHGFRYNVRSLFHLLQEKNAGVSLPHSVFDHNVQAITDEILKRINRSSALWQQFGYLIDMIDVGDTDCRYYTELPKNYSLTQLGDIKITLSLEFGSTAGDVFSVERDPDPKKADESFFLHPVIRFYRGDDLIDVLHLAEDLYGEWTDSVRHVQVLSDFITEKMAHAASQPLSSKAQ